MEERTEPPESYLLSLRKAAAAKRGGPYELRFVEPMSDRLITRRISGARAERIRFMADCISMPARRRRDIPSDQGDVPGIEAGILSALSLANATPEVARERRRQARRFIEWLAERFPAVKTWERLNPMMVQAYAASLERRGLAYDSIRLGLAPVKMGWRLMHREFPNLIRPVPRIPIAAKRREPVECLDPDEAKALLDWMRANDAGLWPMAVLQALAGLRVREAAALRRQDVDLAARTVTVAATKIHRPRSPYSLRTLPVCREVREALAFAIENQKVVPASGELFMNRAGGFWKKSSLTEHWRRALVRAAHETGNDRLKRTSARKLHASFAIIASKLGIPDRLIRVCMGRAPADGDLFNASSRAIQLAELREVAGRFDGWRDLPPTAKR